MTCNRCKKATIGTIMSMFNEDLICMECSDAERKRDDFADALDADDAAIKQGNYNFRGIGLK